MPAEQRVGTRGQIRMLLAEAAKDCGDTRFNGDETCQFLFDQPLSLGARSTCRFEAALPLNLRLTRLALRLRFSWLRSVLALCMFLQQRITYGLVQLVEGEARAVQVYATAPQRRIQCF